MQTASRSCCKHPCGRWTCSLAHAGTRGHASPCCAFDLWARYFSPRRKRGITFVRPQLLRRTARVDNTRSRKRPSSVQGRRSNARASVDMHVERLGCCTPSPTKFDKILATRRAAEVRHRRPRGGLDHGVLQLGMLALTDTSGGFRKAVRAATGGTLEHPSPAQIWRFRPASGRALRRIPSLELCVQSRAPDARSRASQPLPTSGGSQGTPRPPSDKLGS